MTEFVLKQLVGTNNGNCCSRPCAYHAGSQLLLPSVLASPMPRQKAAACGLLRHCQARSLHPLLHNPTLSIKACSFCFTSSTVSVGSTTRNIVVFFRLTLMYILCTAMKATGSVAKHTATSTSRAVWTLFRS
jgi:hypothetical protein